MKKAIYIGKTLKQMARERFFDLIEKKRKLDLDTEEGRHAFISLSVQLHAAKGAVPKSLWRYAN